jgi:hypothetical protein
VATYTTVPLAVKGTVRSAGDDVLVRLTLKGADAARTAVVSLTLDLTLDAAHATLAGVATGKLKTAAGTTALAGDVSLDIAAPMDGTWSLQLALSTTGSATTGSAVLALSSGAQYRYTVRGTAAGYFVTMALIPAADDPGAKALRIAARVQTLDGGWAKITAFAGRGFGQTLSW